MEGLYRVKGRHSLSEKSEGESKISNEEWWMSKRKAFELRVEEKFQNIEGK